MTRIVVSVALALALQRLQNAGSIGVRGGRPNSVVVAAIAAIAAIPLLTVHSCFSTSRSAMCISTAPAMGGHEQVFCPDCRTDAKTEQLGGLKPPIFLVHSFLLCTLDAGRSLARPIYREGAGEREGRIYMYI